MKKLTLPKPATDLWTPARHIIHEIPTPEEAPHPILTSNRPVEDWGKLLGDTAAVTALLDRLLHHAHVLKCGPRSWRTKQPATALHAVTDRRRGPRPSLPTEDAVR